MYEIVFQRKITDKKLNNYNNNNYSRTALAGTQITKLRSRLQQVL